jgi:catechol 2,3-dioxygenase-like lactoylglutathione lyase family enzyme
VKPRLTHLALGVRSLDRTIAFYRTHVHLHVVHERNDGGMRVVWMAEEPENPRFVLVLFEVPANPAPGPTTLQHLGFTLASRAEVEKAADAARADGVLVLEPTDAGPVVGYICMLRDPDGNQVEFSFGQAINPKELPKESARRGSADALREPRGREV